MSRKNVQRKATRGIATVLVLFVLLVVVDVALCLVFQPYGSQSELVWTEYRQTKDIDTVFVGTSGAANGLNPQAFNDAIGAHAYNMSCPGQPFNESLTAVKTAAQDHDLKRVVMFVGYDTMVIDPLFGHGLAYIQAKCATESLPQAAADMASLFTYDYYFKRNYSVLGFFPWAYSHMHLSPSNVYDNIYNRMHYDVFESGRRFTQKNDPNWEYRGLGYGSYNNTMSPNRTHSDVPSSMSTTFSEQNKTALRRLCSFCEEQGIDIYVLGTPYSPYEIAAYGDTYAKGMQSLQDLVTSEGGYYFDLNMLHRDVYDPMLSYFCDSEHLNHTGATQTSAVVAQMVARVEAGEDISGLLFDYSQEGQRAWLESIDFVDAVDYTWEAAGDVARIEATAVTGSATPVEYRMEAQDDAGEWAEVRGWDASPAFELPSNGSGERKIRIYARATNGRQDKDRRVEGTLKF